LKLLREVEDENGSIRTVRISKDLKYVHIDYEDNKQFILKLKEEEKKIEIPIKGISVSKVLEVV
jgi:hypothetical protein